MKSFLQVVDQFSVLEIDEDRSEINENASENDTSDFSSKIVDHDIIQLSNDFIPKGLTPLEKLFDQNDVLRNIESISSEEDIEEINNGTNDHVKSIRICACLDPEIKD